MEGLRQILNPFHIEEMKKLLIPLLSQLLLYCVHYLILPLIIYISPSDAARNNIVIITTTAIISFVVMLSGADKFHYWLLGIPIYFIATMIYHPSDVYGIGYGMFAVEIISIIMITVIVLFTELVTWGVIKILKKIFA